MGDVITLSEHRLARRGRPTKRRIERARFYFDLDCPFTYLTVERVERSFGSVTWIPAVARELSPADARSWRAAEARARDLRLPLSRPDRHRTRIAAAMRVAAAIAPSGRAGMFVLAASRLAFCGGFDLDDPETLAEAAAAAGVPLDDCLRAARDHAHDAALLATGRKLVAAGAQHLPVLAVGQTIHAGERQIGDALRAVRYTRAAARSVG